jgi:hypothetical protein
MLFDSKRVVAGKLPYNLRRIHMYDQLMYSPYISGLFRNLLQQCFSFQFPHGARVASIARQILTGDIVFWKKFYLTGNSFSRTLKCVASRHECGNTLPEKTVVCLKIWAAFLKI